MLWVEWVHLELHKSWSRHTLNKDGPFMTRISTLNYHTVSHKCLEMYLTKRYCDNIYQSIFFHLALGTSVLLKCLTTSMCFRNPSANPNKAWEDHRSFHILGCLNLLNSLLIGCFYFSAYIPKIWCSWTRKCDCGWAQDLLPSLLSYLV